MANLFVALITLSYAFVVGALSEPDINIIVPKGCEGKTFCELEPEKYPHQYFNDYVQAMQKKDFMNYIPYDDIPLQHTIRDEQNCDTIVLTDRPFIIQPNETTYKLVLQSKYFEQRVTRTECYKKGAACFESLKRLGYTNVCKETYGETQLYLYDPIDKQIKHEKVRIPVCCSCSIHRNMK